MYVCIYVCVYIYYVCVRCLLLVLKTTYSSGLRQYTYIFRHSGIISSSNDDGILYL
jgi:hypothetical protein